MEVQENLGKKKIINSLQSMRFIAIMFVFYTHITSANIIYATCGVSFFVILSGFLYGYKNEKETKIIPGTINLLKKKILKFYPLHLITLILSIPFELTIPPTSVVIRNLLLLQCYSKMHYFSFNGVSWFLSLILTLTILTIPLKKIIIKLSNIDKKNMLLILTFIVLVIINFVYCYQINQLNVNLQYWLYVCPIVRIIEYICGMIIGYLMTKIHISISKITSTILEVISIGIIVGILIIPNIPEYIHRNFIWVIPMCFAISIFSIEKGWISHIFRHKWLVLLGNISFEFFMTHQVVLRYVNKYNLLEQIPFIGKFVIELLACILLAQLVSYFLKKIKIEILN